MKDMGKDTLRWMVCLIVLLLLITPLASAQLGSVTHSNSDGWENNDSEVNKTASLTKDTYPTNNVVDLIENGITVDICGYTESGQRGTCPTNSAPQEYYVRYDVPRNTSTGELIGFGDRVVFKVENLGTPHYVDVDVNICWTNMNDRTEIICEYMEQIDHDETENIPMLSTKSDEWFIHIKAWDGGGGDETQIELSYTMTSSNEDRIEPEELDLNSGRKDRVVCKVDCNDQSKIDPVDAYVIKAHEGDQITFKIASRASEGSIWIEDFDACMTFRNEVTISTQLVWNKVCLSDYGDADRNYIVSTVVTTMTHGGDLYIWVWAGNDADETKPEPYSIHLTGINQEQRNWGADRDGDGLNDTHEEACGSDFRDATDTALDFDGDSTCDLLDEDEDNDGVLDIDDDCTQSISGIDYDGDGCTDGEDDDDDNDGRNDAGDDCQRGERDWDSNSTTTDYDSDGCKDETEDLDDDNDTWSDIEEATCISDALDAQSVPNNFDAYHELSTDSERECDASDYDDDEDGILDLYDDLCPFSVWYQYNPESNSISVIDEDVDKDGCYGEEDNDDDDDGITDELDDCPTGDVGWSPSPSTDYDSDGCQDASTEDDDDDNDGITDGSDGCPTGKLDWSSSPSTDHDSDGCQDSDEDDDDDNDGVLDLGPDVCQTGDLDWTSTDLTDHDGDGCRDDDSEDGDRDNDGVKDVADDCPAGSLNWVSSITTDKDSDGCEDGSEDNDDDNDGVNDQEERECDTDPLDPQDQPSDYDADGECDFQEDDMDGDGYLDDNDLCPYSKKGIAKDDSNANGCYDGEEDSDGDEILDSDDECRNEKGEAENGCDPPTPLTSSQKFTKELSDNILPILAVVLIFVVVLASVKWNAVSEMLKQTVELGKLGISQTTTHNDNRKKFESHDTISEHGIKAVDGATVAGESVVGGNQSNDESKQNN